MKKIFGFIASVLLVIFTVSSFTKAQSSQMLLFEIDGNRYEKRNFNKQGELQSFQKLLVGSIEETGDIYKLPVELYLYNVEGELQDSTKTIYTCRPEE